MAAFDRDSALERQQIHEISINVARRLLKLLERSRNAPPHIAAEIAAGARAISDIQREIEQMMSVLPAQGALELAVFTHILGSHRRALDMLEGLEARLSAPPAPSPAPRPVAPVGIGPDAARTHAALIAMSREIEQTAQRQPLPPAGDYRPFAAPGAGNAGPVPAGALPPYQPASPSGAHRQLPPPPGAEFGRRPQPPPAAAKRTSGARLNLPTPASIRAALTDRRVTAAFAVMTVVAGLIVMALSFLGGSLDARRQAALDPEQKLDGRLGSTPSEDTSETAAAGGGMSAEAAPIALPSVSAAHRALMEQPFLVVLSTRRTTEELHQDFRSLKGSYPDILGTAKARVDRVQGQDRQSWYRLSLIPPQSRDDAKDVCRQLKAAGMIGCWIKPLSLGRPTQ
jgi:hypothetical protein